jgi:hypothetical protein
MTEHKVGRVTAGAELLMPGRLYTVGNLTVRCLSHEPGRKPALKLSPLPAWLLHAVARSQR